MYPKTKLGIIVLAGRLLREEGIAAPGVVSAAARKLQLSRKTGYQSAEELRERLEKPEVESRNHQERRELARLRIRGKILLYERDHPEMRFSDSRRHLPPQARSLCVRLLRDFLPELSRTEIAATIGVPLSSLTRWDRQADDSCRFPEKPDHRGAHRRASDEDVERVLAAHGSLEKTLGLEEFTAQFNERHPGSQLDRKTITRILQAHGEREIETRDRDAPYRSHLTVHYPGAQIAIDATETKVLFSGAPPTETIKLKTEVAIDLASAAIVGEAVGEEETAEGVERVIVKARKECEKILAVLCDNGSANCSERVDEVSRRETELGQVFSFPRHPWTNGHIEGLFGQFSRIAGTIEVDDSSRQALAASIVAIIWRIFIHFHNYSPRKRLGGLSPIEYLRRYAPEAHEAEVAREDLKRRRDRARTRYAPNPRLTDPEYRELVQSVLDRTRIEIDADEALKALVTYDESTIRSAARALFIASERDGFDERKRTFAYLMGIVKKKQAAMDAERVRQQLEIENGERERARERAHARERERDAKEEAEDLARSPERVVLKYARLLLRSRMRLLRTFGPNLRRGLEALAKLGRATRSRIEELADTIRSWGEFNEKLKQEMVVLLWREHDSLSNPPP